MKASRAAVKQVRTIEELSAQIQAQGEQIDRLEVMLEEALTLLRAEKKPTPAKIAKAG